MRLSEASQKRGVAMIKKSAFMGQKDPSFINNHSIIDQSLASNNTSLNCSVTSEAALLKLEENL